MPKPFFFQVLEQAEKLHLPKTILIVGPNRSGKSCFGAKICETMDTNFNINRVFFDEEQFLDIVEEIHKIVTVIQKQRGIDYRNYSFWIMGDEVSQSVPAFDWQSVSARIFKKVTDAFGYLHINMVLTEPICDLIKSIRKRVDFQIEMIRPATGRIWRNRPDRWGKKDWRQRLPVHGLELGMPSKKFFKDYLERKHTEEFPKILQNAREELAKKLGKKQSGPSKQELVREYLKKNPEIAKLSQRQIAVKVKDAMGWNTLSQQTVSFALSD